MNFVRCDQTPAWALLERHQKAGEWDIRAAFERDPQRFDRFSQLAVGVGVDFSKNPLNDETQTLLHTLAQQCGVADLRDAMFAGEPINTTEQRQVMHWLLRQPAASLGGALAQPLALVHETLDAMLAYAEQVRGDAQISDVVHIGIGGSDLGPQLVVGALHQPDITGKRFHFVSNVDGHELAAVLAGLQAESTLFLIASKTFTTAETMMNAHSARDWFVRQGGKDTARHFAALTSNRKAAADFGINQCFGFWDWVGGPLLVVVGHRAAHCHCLGRGGFTPIIGWRACHGPPFLQSTRADQFAHAHGIARRVDAQFPRPCHPWHSPLSQWLASLARFFATTRDGEQWQKRGSSGAQPVACHGPGVVG